MLADSKTLLDFVGQLRETTYQEQVARVAAPLTARKLERAFNENLVDSYLKIIENSPKRTARFLRMYLLRFEVEHVKALIKSTNSKLPAEKKLAKIYFQVEDYLKHHALFEDAAKALGIAQVVPAFKGTEYYSPLSIALKNYEETGSTASFDIFLDRHFYDELYERFRKLSKSEQAYAEFYVSMESDGFTLFTLLRGKLLNLDPNRLRLLLPQNFLRLKPSKVEAIVSAIDFEAALKIVFETPYGRYFNKAQDPHETVANAQKTFSKVVVEHAMSSVIIDTFNIGLPLAFITHKEAEVHNLTALSLGVEAAMAPEAIRNLLLV